MSQSPPSIVRRSCREFVSRPACLASIDTSAIPQFLHSLDRTKYQSILDREKLQMTFPLSFPSDASKGNFYSILHLLNFGSGFRNILKRANGSGAFDNIIKLLISAHLSHDSLDAEWMTSITAHEVAEMMRIGMTDEVPVNGNTALLELRPSDASVLVHKITEALNTTGAFLTSSNVAAKSLFAYIESCIASSADVDALLDALSLIPALRDRVTLDDGSVVCVYKKMQVMLSELMRNGVSIPYLSSDSLTIFADNVIPTMLVHHGLISCDSANAALTSDAQISELQALSLRASAIVVCEEIIKVARDFGMDWVGNEVDLDNYLWKVAKDEQLRKLPRYSDRSTWFY